MFQACAYFFLEIVWYFLGLRICTGLPRNIERISYLDARAERPPGGKVFWRHHFFLDPRTKR